MGKVISTLLFQPPEQPTHLSSRKYFWLTTSKGSKIPAFFIQQNHARYTLLYSHGNAEDLGMIYDYLVQLSQLLYVNIFAYDYSGYGMGSRRKDNIAKGIEPSEQNCYADIEAAFQHLMQVEMINLSQLILYGRSVGSGPSCYLAQKLNVKRDEFEFEFKGDNVAGLILHSPFLSVCRVVVDMGLEMSYDYFPNVSRIKDVGCPTFILHGSKDEVGKCK
jgi:pimeloyl-ACP methyl ester carboxylesterase